MRRLELTPLAEFAAAEEKYLKQTGWQKHQHSTRYNQWSHPSVRGGQAFDQHDAVRAQLTRDNEL